MKLKTTVYKLKNNQTTLFLPSSIMEKYNPQGIHSFKIKGISFLSQINKSVKLNKSGSTHIRGVVTIPKKVADHLLLNNKEEVEITVYLN